MIEICAACGHIKDHHKPACGVEECSCPEFLEPTEFQTCPRRMSEYGPWDHKENQDHWSTSHWGEFYKSTWPEGFEKPRACSFCGGIHPDDAIRLLEQGWELEPTYKSYKAYLQPPGANAHHLTTLKAIREQNLDDIPDFIFPVPPVQIYAQHLSEEHLKRIQQLEED